MEVLIFIMALLVSFPGKINRAIKSLTALLVFRESDRAIMEIMALQIY